MEVGFGSGAPPIVTGDHEVCEVAPAVDLPPGFRFHPTDEEIIMHYLAKKVTDKRFSALAIGEADFNKCEPWDLPSMAKMGEKEWFFFSRRDRKYPTGVRTNRATGSGYWKATGKDKEIRKGRNTLVGMKKTLVFYGGRAPKGEKTNWVMHEYRLEGDFLSSLRAANSEEWVVSKVLNKNAEIRRNVDDASTESFVVDNLLNRPRMQMPSADPISVTNDCKSDESKDNPALPSSLLWNDQKISLSPTQNRAHSTMSNPFSTPFNLRQQNPNISPNSVFQHQAPAITSTLGFQLHAGEGSAVPSNPWNAVPFKGADTASLSIMAPKMEAGFSPNSSVISRSQETGLSTENVANEITSVPPVLTNYKPLDQELEDLSFIYNMADLDFLWS